MSKLDYARGKHAGRLLRYDPHTDEVTVLATGIWFANGIAIDKDETFVMISESFAGRALKYHIQGDNKGESLMEVMADKFPGYPDGADCSWSTGLCYAPLPSSQVMIMTWIWKLPHPIDMILRSLLMMLPRHIAPKIVPYGGVMEIFPGNYTHPAGKIVRVLQDPKGRDISMLTGVTLHDNKIYMGSHKNPFIGVYDLQG